MRPDDKAAFKTVLLVVGTDTVAVSIIAALVIRGQLSATSLAMLGFCLFWADYMLARQIQPIERVSEISFTASLRRVILRWRAMGRHSVRPRRRV
jgi:hypothetical protein